jgi:hypothetical protein
MLSGIHGHGRRAERTAMAMPSGVHKHGRVRVRTGIRRALEVGAYAAGFP